MKLENSKVSCSNVSGLIHVSFLVIAVAAYNCDLVSCAVSLAEIQHFFVINLEDVLKLVGLQKIGYKRPFSFFEYIANNCICVMDKLVILAE